MSLAVGKGSSNIGEEDRRHSEGRTNQQTTEAKHEEDRGERRRRPISKPISLSSIDENQMVWLCVTFKFVRFDGIKGKKLADKVAREKR